MYCDGGLFRIPGMIFLTQTQARPTVIEFFSTLTLHEFSYISLYLQRFLLVCDGGIQVTISGSSPDPDMLD